VVSLLVSTLAAGKGIMSAFGAEQFVLPEQDVALNRYFTGLYFLLNCGSVVGMIVMPMLRNLSCFGRDTCYTLALGVVACMSLITPSKYAYRTETVCLLLSRYSSTIFFGKKGLKKRQRSKDSSTNSGLLNFKVKQNLRTKLVVQ
jgi:hypothetical protein